MATYEIPTAQGYQTVNADTKQSALGMVPNATLNVPSSMSATNLGNGATPTIAPVKVKDASNKLAATVGAVSNVAETNFSLGSAEQGAAVKEDPKKGLTDRIRDIIGLQGKQGERTLQVQQEEGVQQKKTLARKLENDIIAKTRSYDKQIESIRQNAGGMFGGAVEQEINNLERQKNSELADMAIQYKVAAGDYNEAFQIAQSKIEAEFEPLKNEITSLTNLFNLYQNDLTESEKMQVQAKISEQQAQLNFKRDQEMYKYKQQIDQQDPMYKAQLANIYSQIRDRDTKPTTVQPGGTITLPSIVNPVTGKVDPLGQLTQAIGATELKNNEQMQTITGVISAAQQFADRVPSNGKIPGTGTFRSFGPFLGPQGQANTTSLEAINLNVQKWASGAALTDAQTKQVNKFTIRESDTANQVRNKLNGLTNFMLSQARGQFAAQGYNLPIQDVDFFPRGQEVTAPDGKKIIITD